MKRLIVIKASKPKFILTRMQTLDFR